MAEDMHEDPKKLISDAIANIRMCGHGDRYWVEQYHPDSATWHTSGGFTPEEAHYIARWWRAAAVIRGSGMLLHHDPIKRNLFVAGRAKLILRQYKGTLAVKLMKWFRAQKKREDAKA